jgi:hypothetical protein
MFILLIILYAYTMDTSMVYPDMTCYYACCTVYATNMPLL